MEKLISCDWGTSNFRLRLVNTETQEVLQEVLQGTGIANTFQQWKSQQQEEGERISFYKKVLADCLRQFEPDFDKYIPVIISGMASSSIGMMEIPYQDFPFTWDAEQFPVTKVAASNDLSHPVFLVSGFKTNDDVMRGEETILFGCEVDENANTVFIFPGTHSKHVFVKNKTAVNFKTYMTGEIFSLLVNQSVLKNSVTPGNDEPAFEQGILLGRDGDMLHDLFTVRTRQLLQHKDAVSNYQYLSGILIGTELASLKECNSQICIVTASTLKELYRKGAELLKLSEDISWVNADQALINAHCKIARHIS
jgi:2-dehydro-3-deoxygalactonokinase